MNENEILNEEGLETLEEVTQSSGSIVGIMLATGAIAAIGVTAFLYFRKKKRETLDEEDYKEIAYSELEADEDEA